MRGKRNERAVVVPHASPTPATPPAPEGCRRVEGGPSSGLGGEKPTHVVTAISGLIATTVAHQTCLTPEAERDAPRGDTAAGAACTARSVAEKPIGLDIQLAKGPSEREMM